MLCRIDHYKAQMWLASYLVTISSPDAFYHLVDFKCTESYLHDYTHTMTSAGSLSLSFGVL